MLYELMKKAYFLSREKKEYLHDNFEEILSIVQARKENKKDTSMNQLEEKRKGKRKQNTDVETKQNMEQGYIPRSYTHSPGKLNSGPFNQTSLGENKTELKKEARVHDPETAEEMLKIIGLLEKFISVDGDLSYENLCVFIVPLANGSRKLVLRPYKIVGLTKILELLARKFQKNKDLPRRKMLLQQVENNFHKTIEELRKRLSGEDGMSSPIKNPPSKIRFRKKAQSEIGDFRNRLSDAILNFKSMGATPEDARQMAQNFSTNLSYDISDMIEGVIAEVFGQ